MSQPNEGRPLAHIVYFSLKEKTDENRQALLDSCQEYLTGHEGVVFYGAGLRGEEFNRPVNDAEFDVGLHVVFENKAAHDRYQESSRHQAFLAENKAGWSSVRVFDAYL